MSPKMPDMGYLNIKMDREVREKLEEQAKMDRRSLGAEALYLIERGLQQMREDLTKEPQGGEA